MVVRIGNDVGFFRRYKLSDHTADECRAKLKELEDEVLWGSDTCDNEGVAKLMEEWACFRELLARHEGKNKSQLDG